MQPSRLFDLLAHQQKNYSQENMLVNLKNQQRYPYTTAEVIEQVNQVSAGLLYLGIEPGDKIAIISSNRPEWNFIDLGCQQVGAITVPTYTKINTKELEHIFNHAQIKLVFAEGENEFSKIQKIQSEIPSIEGIYTFEKISDATHWSQMTQAAEGEVMEQVNRRKEQVKTDDLATIVYTSGTTGQPKGVMLSHHNILSNVWACRALMPVNHQHRALSFLPLNHIFERMLNYLYMSSGLSIYYTESTETISEDISEVKPHIFTTVPRLLEKIYERIVERGKAQPFLARNIFFWALGLAQDYDFQGKSWWYQQQLALADRLVFKKWRKALGGETIAIISGGAALNKRINRVFNAARISVMEGYGLTETSPVLAVNRYEKEGRKIGTVGPPLENVEIKISQEGEILCKGPNVTKGYYQQADKTQETIKDGWLYTGDMGAFEQGFLKITARKKSMFKTSGGKYVSPEAIEEHLKSSHLIGHAVVLGEGKKMVTALIVPDFENLESWSNENHIPWQLQEEAVKHEAVRQHYEEIIEQKNQQFNHTEQIKKFRLIGDEWSEGSGELTPTLKVKRAVVEQKYEALIEEMYGETPVEN